MDISCTLKLLATYYCFILRITSKWTSSTWSGSGVSRLWPSLTAKSSPRLFFVSKVLWEHSHAHLCKRVESSFLLILQSNLVGSLCNRLYVPWSLKYLPSDSPKESALHPLTLESALGPRLPYLCSLCPDSTFRT